MGAKGRTAKRSLATIAVGMVESSEMLPGAELVAGAAARLAVVVALDRERGEGRGLGGASAVLGWILHSCASANERRQTAKSSLTRH